MGYFGTFLLARSDRPLTDLPGVDAFGYKHRRLRELGDGWQVLETQGFDDPPDLVEATRLRSRSWGAPLLAAYSSNGGCAQVQWASVEGEVWSMHLTELAVDGCGYRHRPEFDPGNSAAAMLQDLSDWAAVAGLTVSPRRLAATINHRKDDPTHLPSHEQVYELIRALGFPDIPPSRPYHVHPRCSPLNAITTPYVGIADRARIRAMGRADDDDPDLELGPEEPWEARAIELELDIHAAVFGGGHTYEQLADRVEALIRDHADVEDVAHMADREWVDDVDYYLDYHGPNLYDMFAGTGTWPELR